MLLAHLFMSSGALEREDDRVREKAEENFLTGMERLLESSSSSGASGRTEQHLENKTGGIDKRGRDAGQKAEEDQQSRDGAAHRCRDNTKPWARAAKRRLS